MQQQNFRTNDEKIYDLIVNQGIENGAEVGRRLSITREAVRQARERLNLPTPSEKVFERNTMFIEKLCLGEDISVVLQQLNLKRTAGLNLVNKYNKITDLHELKFETSDIAKTVNIRKDFVEFCIACSTEHNMKKIVIQRSAKHYGVRKRDPEKEERDKKIASMAKVKSLKEVAAMHNLSPSTVRKAQHRHGTAKTDPAKLRKASLYIEVYARYVIDQEPSSVVKNELKLSEHKFRHAVMIGRAIAQRYPGII